MQLEIFDKLCNMVKKAEDFTSNKTRLTNPAGAPNSPTKPWKTPTEPVPQNITDVKPPSQLRRFFDTDLTWQPWSSDDFSRAGVEADSPVRNQTVYPISKSYKGNSWGFWSPKFRAAGINTTIPTEEYYPVLYHEIAGHGSDNFGYDAQRAYYGLPKQRQDIPVAQLGNEHLVGDSKYNVHYVEMPSVLTQMKQYVENPAGNRHTYSSYHPALFQTTAGGSVSSYLPRWHVTPNGDFQINTNTWQSAYETEQHSDGNYYIAEQGRPNFSTDFQERYLDTAGQGVQALRDLQANPHGYAVANSILADEFKPLYMRSKPAIRMYGDNYNAETVGSFIGKALSRTSRPGLRALRDGNPELYDSLSPEVKADLDAFETTLPEVGTSLPSGSAQQRQLERWRQIREKYRRLGVVIGGKQPNNVSLNPDLIDFMTSQQYTEGVDHPIDRARGIGQYLRDAAMARKHNWRWAVAGQNPTRLAEFKQNPNFSNFKTVDPNYTGVDVGYLPPLQQVQEAHRGALDNVQATNSFESEDDVANAWFDYMDASAEPNIMLDYYKSLTP